MTSGVGALCACGAGVLGSFGYFGGRPRRRTAGSGARVLSASMRCRSTSPGRASGARVLSASRSCHSTSSGRASCALTRAFPSAGGRVSVAAARKDAPLCTAFARSMRSSFLAGDARAAAVAGAFGGAAGAFGDAAARRVRVPLGFTTSRNRLRPRSNAPGESPDAFTSSSFTIVPDSSLEVSSRCAIPRTPHLQAKRTAQGCPNGCLEYSGRSPGTPIFSHGPHTSVHAHAVRGRPCTARRAARTSCPSGAAEMSRA